MRARRVHVGELARGERPSLRGCLAEQKRNSGTTLVFALVLLVALEHLYFLYLEMFLWTQPKGLRIFGNTAEKAEASELRKRFSDADLPEDVRKELLHAIERTAGKLDELLSAASTLLAA